MSSPLLPDVSDSAIARAIAAEIQLLLSSGPASIDRMKAIGRLADEGRILLQTVAAIRARLGIVEQPPHIEPAHEPNLGALSDGYLLTLNAQPSQSQQSDRLRRSLGLRNSGVASVAADVIPLDIAQLAAAGR